ncbi:MAG: hypothetical protein HYZ74_02925 [Elusimicrobia bacterium]|nr:hypothetical protein [Elusimicrobiota bacterium]
MMNSSLSALVLSTLLAASAHATPAFKIVCELNAAHDTDTDRLDPQREIKLMREAVEATYPNLSPELQSIAEKVPFVINHSQKVLTKTYGGWSAEDDPEYRYPDTHFFGETYVDADGATKQGTIKTNYTEKFIRALDLGARLGEKDPAVRRGMLAYAGFVIAHELEHARQYHHKPVRDFAQEPSSIKDGLADAVVLKETKLKIEYEHQAFAAHRRYVAGKEADLTALADALEAYAKAHPAETQAGGAYALLAAGVANPFVARLRDEIKYIPLGERFTETAHILYYGQAVPPELTLRAKRLADTVRTARSAAASLDADISSTEAEWTKELEAMDKEWKSFMASGPMSEKLVQSFPYLKGVVERYERERAYLKEALKTP